jgi:hypothetical protein
VNAKMTVFLVLGMLLIGVAVAPRPANADDACPICDFDMSTYDGPLTEAEVHGLLLALNDEYHAWAVYDQVLADHGDVRPFSNIKGSEATHIQALVGLFDAYDVPVPDNPWPGDVPSFETVTDACALGVEAEIANRDLYTDIMATTERDDILTVYLALQKASDENHLPAFERCAEGSGSGGNQGNRGQRGGSDQGEPGRGRQEPGGNNGSAGPGNGQCEPGSGSQEPQNPGQGSGSGSHEPGSGRGGSGSGQRGRQP